MVPFIALAAILTSSPAGPTVAPFEYQDGNTLLEGQIAYPLKQGNLPAVIIVHDWNGIDDYEKRRIKEFAELGYVAFAADIYGKGVRPRGMQECAAEAGKYYANNDLLRSRIKSAIHAVRKNPRVDGSRIAIIGYCFGGMCAIEAVRAGFGVKGAVSFHGNFKTSRPARKGLSKGEILVLHGDADKAAPIKDLEDLEQEMKQAGIAIKAVIYSGVDHAFTVPGSPRYDEKADKASWQEAKPFLKRLLK